MSDVKGAQHTHISRAKLPFWRTVGHAYGFLSSNLSQALRISWLWLVIMIPIVWAMSWLYVPSARELLQASQPGSELSLNGKTLPNAIGVLESLIMLPMLASIAVAWHRLILRHEHVEEAYYLRLGRTVLFYALALLGIQVIASSGDYLLQFFELLGIGRETALGLTLFGFTNFLMFAGVYVIARFSMALPALALNDPGNTFAQSWKRTKGNIWRLVSGYFFCALPTMAILGGGNLLVLTIFEDRMAASIAMATLNLVSVLLLLIQVGFLSFAYRHFFEATDTEQHTAETGHSDI